MLLLPATGCVLFSAGRLVPLVRIAASPRGSSSPDLPGLLFQTVLANILSFPAEKMLCVAEPISIELLEHMIFFSGAHDGVY